MIGENIWEVTNHCAASQHRCGAWAGRENVLSA